MTNYLQLIPEQILDEAPDIMAETFTRSSEAFAPIQNQICIFYDLTNNSKSTKSEKSGKTKAKVKGYHRFRWMHITGIARIISFNSSIVRL